MTRLSAPIKASMKKTATALTLACSLLSVMSISQAQAADNIDVSFQTILQQERNWAGLQSKSLKVGDITWSYSEGGSSTKPTLLLIHGLAAVEITGTELPIISRQIITLLFLTYRAVAKLSSRTTLIIQFQT